MSLGPEKPEGTLNEHQRRRLRVTCLYIDKLLGEVETILNVSASKAAFPRFVPDIPPAQRRTIEDYITRVRAQLLRVLDGQGIEREAPTIPCTRAVHVNLLSADIAIEELEPHYMRGYGPVPEGVARELEGIVGELQGLVSRVDRFVLHGAGEDFKSRLDRLAQTQGETELLTRIEQVVTGRGLVEFRSTIAAILDRLEDKSFQIAVFGRVSSGKSSLLNAILDTGVLPVGVTPITTVPTTIACGTTPALTVWFADKPAKQFPVEKLPEFATEQQNPGNSKHVSRIVVALPAARLNNGVTFVDTPGLGSLATSGAAETLAYLPKCDLGVVLIDAASTLTPDDLNTIQALEEAATPINILLSKADLLAPADLNRVIQYVKEHIASECRLDLPVHAVSVMPGYKKLVDGWFEKEILPLYGRSAELKSLSLRRKIGSVRESVVAALQAVLRRKLGQSEKSQEQVRDVEARLRHITGNLQEARAHSESEADEIQAAACRALEGAAADLTTLWSGRKTGGPDAESVVREKVLQSVRKQSQELLEEFRELAREAAAVLQAAAGAFEMTDAPEEEELLSIVREMPVFDLGLLSVRLKPPKFRSLLGDKLASRNLAHRLKEQVGTELQQRTTTYVELLKSWARNVSGQLKQRFDTYADGYRAQAACVLGGRAITGQEEEHELIEDLKVLGAQPPEQAVQAAVSNP